MIVGMTNQWVDGGRDLTVTVTAPLAFKKARLKIPTQFAIVSILVGLDYIFQSDDLRDPKASPSILTGRLFEGDGTTLTFDAMVGQYIRFQMLNLSPDQQMFSGFLEIP